MRHNTLLYVCFSFISSILLALLSTVDLMRLVMKHSAVSTKFIPSIMVTTHTHTQIIINIFVIYNIQFLHMLAFYFALSGFVQCQTNKREILSKIALLSGGQYT